MLNLSAFHDYDIRGVYPDEINEDFYYELGRALAVHVGAGPIAVGHDMRLSSPALSASLIEGIITQGIDVVRLGMISTEMHYFASGKYQYAANIVVSASHNPPQYNGAKIVLKDVVPLHGSFGLDKIKELMTKGQYPECDKKGVVTDRDIFKEWIDHAISFIDTDSLKKMKIVVDAGNGMGGPAWESIASRLSQISLVSLYTNPDGTFPHHLADPLKDENTRELEGVIRQEKADIGLALDGDADRVFFFDNNGKKISATVISALLAEYFLKKHNGGTILYGAICGKIVPQTVKKHGGTAVRTRVGHSFIKEQMKKLGAHFAGEHSGHFYFGGNYNADSSLIAGLIVISILAKSGCTLSELVAPYDVYRQSGERNFKAENISDVMNTIEKEYAPLAVSVDHLDGLTVWYNDYWFSVRASKTEPLLRLNVEADTMEILAQKTNELQTLLARLGATPK